ncbi:MAG: ThuA domain-containing protein [Verrucomicrobiae bacterium]|nr:ThuA domain-containing protein [Verrucomicrobiae bacterium]
MHVGNPMKVQFRNIMLKRLSLADRKKVVFLAGNPSHGRGAHEHRAGCQLLAKELEANAGDQLLTTVYTNGWPADPTALQNADAVVIFCDGGDGHLARPHLRQLEHYMKKGVGLGCIHYAVEITKGEAGDRLKEWTGGYFETHWSVNPHWTAKFGSFPEHPVTRGVKPFEVNDEWYYHMRFKDEMKGVTPILTAVPPKETLNRPDGPHSGNPAVRATEGQPQHVHWVVEREDGGRGFGFTGAHFHKNWGDDSFRKVVLNAITWIAKGEVPEGGIPSATPTQEELESNLDN